MSGPPFTGGASTDGASARAAAARDERVWPNAWLVARREFHERVASRLFVVSTLLLAVLAVGTALTPVILRALDRGTTSTIAIVATDDALGSRTESTLTGILNASASDPAHPPFTFTRIGSADGIDSAVGAGTYDAAVIVGRDAGSGITFRLVTGSAVGDQAIQTLQVGMFAVSIFDWIARGHAGSDDPFVQPRIDVFAATGASAGSGAAIGAAEFAGRRVVGIVFVVLIFITLVIYGMWVAAGVVAEKSSRVMELLISAASPAQLVVGKVIGIGLAGLVQYVGIVIPAVVTLLLEDRIAGAVLGVGGSLGVSLGVLSPVLLAAYGGFWILGFVLYSLLYAAAGSLVSRAEDLQVLALPLSLVAIAGYLLAVLSLSGGVSTLTRVASLVPFWSPFMMLTRLTVGRAEAWEVLAAYGFLVAAILVVGVVAVRVYSAGVLLYGQRPGLRAIVGAVISPPV